MLDEALRQRRAPGVAFVDGVTGRRAVVAGTGLEVWEVVAAWKDADEDLTRTSEAFSWLSDLQVRAALGYYQLYPDEIDRRLAREDAWTRERLRAELPFAVPQSGSRVRPFNAMRFLLDEDLPPHAAVIARSLGLDVVSVHEIGRRGLTDEDQLSFAASETRILVTRNRDDFIALTHRGACATNAPHRGVLLVLRGAPNTHPERIARSLGEWAARFATGHPGSGFVDFL